MVAKISAEQIARLRLQTLGLINSHNKTAADAVRNLLAMQAQDFGAALWAVGLRVPGSHQKDVSEALSSGEVVRSWPMRGTLHLVAAEDLQWMLKLTTDKLIKGTEKRRQRLELDMKTLDKARSISIDALSGGKRMSRDEYVAALEAGGINVDNRGYHIIWHLSQTGTLVWGPPGKVQQDLVLFDEWITKPRLLERDEALGEFVLRYIQGHGPATIRDFVWWTKLTMGEAKIGFNIVRDKLVELNHDDTSFWMTADAFDSADKNLASAKKSVFALPAFDEHLLGYQDRSHVVSSEYLKRILPSNGVFSPTIVAGGTVVGTWKAASGRGKKDPIYELFDDATPQTVKGFSTSIDAFRKFLG